MSAIYSFLELIAQVSAQSKDIGVRRTILSIIRAALLLIATDPTTIAKNSDFPLKIISFSRATRRIVY